MRINEKRLSKVNSVTFIMFFVHLLFLLESCNLGNGSVTNPKLSYTVNTTLSDTIAIDKSQIRSYKRSLGLILSLPDSGEKENGQLNVNYKYNIINIGTDAKYVGDLDLYNLTIIENESGRAIEFRRKYGFWIVESSADNNLLSIPCKRGVSDENDCFDLYLIKMGTTTPQLVDSNICTPTNGYFFKFNGANFLAYLKQDKIIAYSLSESHASIVAVLKYEHSFDLEPLGIKIEPKLENKFGCTIFFRDDNGSIFEFNSYATFNNL